MIHDTSSFKGIRMQRKDLVTDIATERVLANREDATDTTHDFEFKMRQVWVDAKQDKDYAEQHRADSAAAQRIKWTPSRFWTGVAGG